ncbi:hypothetical protein HMPREF0673_01401 [Leyella stercorea DSM 18206]|uniref:Uncharacterized protein n=1 Tax=Leyella stercorea DSM 18206 TaxID=1002367 RepID=G6AXP5_9BACT|nr:hypothetical protein HMPREF0673_01401 [Leyella stercorea DSM 18206]
MLLVSYQQVINRFVNNNRRCVKTRNEDIGGYGILAIPSQFAINKAV